MSRTLLDVDDDLIRRARRATGLKKKVDIINKALEEFVQLPSKHIRWLVKMSKQRKEQEKRLR